MDLEKGHRRSRGFSTLEKYLIFLFVAMTGACIGLVVVYFTDKAEAPAPVEGECVRIYTFPGRQRERQEASFLSGAKTVNIPDKYEGTPG